MPEPIELAEARDQLDKAVKNLVAVQARLQGITLDPIVTGWVGYAEYTSIELQRSDATGNVKMVPDAQSFSLTRGLFECGLDGYRNIRR